MKKCTNCSKDIPDTAAHCVFCGSKQGQAQPAPPVAQKTIMGYSAGDLANLIPGVAPRPPAGDPQKTLAVNVGAAYGGGGGPPPMSAPPAGDPQKTLAVNIGGAYGGGGGPPPMGAQPPASEQKTQAISVGGFGGGAPMGAPPSSAQQKTLAVSVPGAGQFGGGAPMSDPQRTMMAPGYGGAPLPNQGGQGMGPGGMGPGGGGGGGYSAGSGMAPPSGMAAPGTPGYVPQQQPQGEPQMQVASPHVMGDQQGYGQQGGGGYAQQGGYAPQPQYLASQSMSGGMAGDPFAGALRTALIVFGIGLIITVVAPWSLGGGSMVFGFSVLTQSEIPFTAKLLPIVFGATGFLALLFGLIPAASTVRGLVAAVVGLAPMVLAMVVAGFGIPGAGAGWQGWVALAGFALAPAGLFIRSGYRDAVIGRLVATIGCGAILALHLIPQEGVIPIVAIFKGLGSLSGAASIVAALGDLLPPIVALIGLISVWMPGSTSGGAGLWAWLLILVAPLVALCEILLGGDLGAAFHQPGQFYLLFDLIGWGALAGYGLAAVLGKSAEA